jgi:hypothetical protein
MKRIFFPVIVMMLFSTTLFAQNFAETDISPMDMAYYPNNFAHDRKPGQQAIIRVIYSRPSKNGREIFGQVVPFHKVWRTGANEASEIKFYRDVELNGKPVKAGTYSLFTMPDEKEWDIILNSDLDYWGAFSYDYHHDVVSVKAPSKSLPDPVENFTIQFKSTGANQGLMQLAWDKTLVEVPFTF